MNKLHLFAILPLLCAFLSHAQCNPDEFLGSGTGANEEEALNTAYSQLARQIHSSVKVSEKYTQSQNVTGGKENLSSDYASKTVVEASLGNAHDARVLRMERNAGKVSVSVCMSRSNAAKGFAEQQRLVGDSLEIAANASLGAEHPKSKDEAWQKTQRLWNEFSRLQGMLDGFGVAKADLFELASGVYSKAREEHIAYCGSKLHWVPEKGNNYSELALSKLSQNLEMEKSACKGKGVSLAYKNTEPECSRKFGLYNCSYKPSLAITSCEGREYRLLEGFTEGIHQKEELALEKLQGNLKAADYWKKWEQEIKEWSPICR
jgi:hypothetical protein